MNAQATNKHPEPDLEEKQTVMIEHLLYLYEFYGTHGTRIARKHVGWYCEHLQHGQKLKQQVNELDEADSQVRAVVNHFEKYEPYEEKAA